MSSWTPDWKITINGSEVTDITLVGLTITSGRTDINSSTQAGYCSFSIINLNGSTYNWTVNTSVTIQVKDTSGVYVNIFGGRISDLSVVVDKAGSTAVLTRYDVIALGAIAKLQRASYDGSITEGLDGAQIAQVLNDLFLASWNEVPPAETWAAYNPTVIWTNAGNVGLGQIDAGDYTLVSQSAETRNLYAIVSQIAASGLGYLYEDANGLISYADASHRQDYLIANGYVTLDANSCEASNVNTTIRQGDLINKYQIDYGNNYGNTVIAEDAISQATYGTYETAIQSLVKSTTDATAIANRLIDLRAYPYSRFTSITFRLQNPELDDADRDALLNIFMGMPVAINNLPSNISGGSFLGFVEGWTFQATVSGLSIRLNMSPTEFNAFTQAWEDVAASLTWAGVSATLTWQNATGALT